MKKIYNFCFTTGGNTPDPKNLQLLKTVPAEAIGNIKEPLYLDRYLYYILRTPERKFTEGDDYMFVPHYEVNAETGVITVPEATLESGGDPGVCFKLDLSTSTPLIEILGSPNSTDDNLDILTLYGDWRNIKTKEVKEGATDVAIKILLPQYIEK